MSSFRPRCSGAGPRSGTQQSDSLGFRLKRGEVAYTADKPFQINSKGLRGPERSWEKAAGVRRILILGDSIAFGYGVTYENTFANRLEDLLNAGEGNSYEVIDSGVPSFNTLQEVTYFREEGIRFEPDVVILALCWNDINSKSSVAVDREGFLIQPGVKPSSFQRWTETEQGYRVRNLVKRSSFLYFVVNRVRVVKERLNGQVPQETQIRSAVLTGGAHPAVAAGWAEVGRQVAGLAELCASRGIQLLVTALPMPELLEGGPYPGSQYPGEVVRLCRRLGINCVDLLPAFQRQFHGHASLFIPYDGDHPNERGHRIIADSLYSVLREGASPRPSFPGTGLNP